MKKLIYLDNAATTKTAPEVVEAMLPYFTEHYGNPSTVYSLGRREQKGRHRSQGDHRESAWARRPRRSISPQAEARPTTGL